MSNQEDLPVWAKILLGIPERDAAEPENRKPAPAASDRRCHAASDPEHETGQSVRSFVPSERNCKWVWPSALRPFAKEFPL